MVIYRITNKITGKCYIGQTVQKLKDRWHDHIRGDKQPEGYLHRAINKYGAENFTMEEIDSSKTTGGLNVLEEFYIRMYDTISPKGYNLHPGGFNKMCHPDTKEKISRALKGREIPNRWSGGNTTTPSEETRAKISATLKGRPIANRYTGGNKSPRTEEQKKHLSKLNKGKPNMVLNKRIFCIETGEVFESINEAAAALGVNRVTVSSWLKTGKAGRLGKTFRFIP
jgi:group I intron endonuclease